MTDIPRDIDLTIETLHAWSQDKPWVQVANPDRLPWQTLMINLPQVAETITKVRQGVLQLDLSQRQGMSPCVEEMFIAEWQVLGNYVANFILYFMGDNRYDRDHRHMFEVRGETITQILNLYSLCWITQALSEVKTIYNLPENRSNTDVINWVWIAGLLVEINDEIFLNYRYPVLSAEKLDSALAITQKQGETWLHTALLGIKRYLIQAAPVLKSKYGTVTMDQLVNLESSGAFIVNVCGTMEGYQVIEENKLIYALGYLHMTDKSRNKYIAQLGH